MGVEGEGSSVAPGGNGGNGEVGLGGRLHRSCSCRPAEKRSTGESTSNSSTALKKGGCSNSSTDSGLVSGVTMPTAIESRRAAQRAGESLRRGTRGKAPPCAMTEEGRGAECERARRRAVGVCLVGVRVEDERAREGVGD